MAPRRRRGRPGPGQGAFNLFPLARQLGRGMVRRQKPNWSMGAGRGVYVGGGTSPRNIYGHTRSARARAWAGAGARAGARWAGEHREPLLIGAGTAYVGSRVLKRMRVGVKRSGPSRHLQYRTTKYSRKPARHGTSSTIHRKSRTVNVYPHGAGPRLPGRPPTAPHANGTPRSAGRRRRAERPFHEQPRRVSFSVGGGK